MLGQIFADSFVMPKHIVMFINSSELFLSHRQHLARGAMEAGYKLTVLVPPGPNVQVIRDLGYNCETVTLGRKSIFPGHELRALISLYLKLKNLKPDILHSFTIKPVLYGSLVAKWLGIPRVVNTVTGLGFAFIDSGLKATVIRAILSVLYRFAFSDKTCEFIFQNRDDQEFYLKNNWVRQSQSLVIPGTGVDFEVFKPLALEVVREIPVILFAGRYLKDKGLGELIKACTELFRAGFQFRLLLSGQIDNGNPNSFSVSDVESWKQHAFIENLGHQKNMPAIYRLADIFCLPSYREGLPLALIEAAATGCALVATDVPGCREIVKTDENGFLVKARSVESLQAALQHLLVDGNLRQRFSTNARKMAMIKFNKTDLVDQGLQVYNSVPRNLTA